MRPDKMTTKSQEAFRDAVSDALDAYLSMQSHRLNDVMKALTMISTIMLPLMFITGLYGMNFEVMPELKWEYGYFAALIVMAITATIISAWGLPSSTTNTGDSGLPSEPMSPLVSIGA